MISWKGINRFELLIFSLARLGWAPPFAFGAALAAFAAAFAAFAAAFAAFAAACTRNLALNFASLAGAFAFHVARLVALAAARLSTAATTGSEDDVLCSDPEVGGLCSDPELGGTGCGIRATGGPA